jgi:MFS family permease
LNRFVIAFFPLCPFQLGDQHRFDAEQQHALAEQLSFIDAGAIVCAPLSGYLLDSVGFKFTAVVTIGLGIFQQLLLLVAGQQTMLMRASFVCYAVFRAFLFPYFFASLSKKMGFRYFGFLSGLPFFVSGLCQFAIAPLAVLVEGTCHEYHDANRELAADDCSEGNWTLIHAVQIASLVGLLLIPFLDGLAERNEQAKEALLPTPELSPSSYGSLDSCRSEPEASK